MVYVLNVVIVVEAFQHLLDLLHKFFVLSGVHGILREHAYLGGEEAEALCLKRFSYH